MAHFEILVGTVLGASEYVADALKQTLEDNAHQAQVHLQPDLAELDSQHIWLVCTSTHGAGDLPDNIQPFADSLKNQPLTGTRYLLVGLGDSSYDTFCNAAVSMQALLDEAGANALTEPLHIDVLNHPIPEDLAVEWLQGYLDHAAL